jgi:hypothetical protein
MMTFPIVWSYLGPTRTQTSGWQPVEFDWGPPTGSPATGASAVLVERELARGAAPAPDGPVHGPTVSQSEPADAPLGETGSHAAAEIERFSAVCGATPDGGGWFDPTVDLETICALAAFRKASPPPAVYRSPATAGTIGRTGESTEAGRRWRGLPSCAVKLIAVRACIRIWPLNIGNVPQKSSGTMKVDHKRQPQGNASEQWYCGGPSGTAAI